MAPVSQSDGTSQRLLFVSCDTDTKLSNFVSSALNKEIYLRMFYDTFLTPRYLKIRFWNSYLMENVITRLVFFLILCVDFFF